MIRYDMMQLQLTKDMTVDRKDVKDMNEGKNIVDRSALSCCPY